MQDVVLISPPTRCDSRWIPIGLAQLASNLEVHGYSTKIIDIKERTPTPRSIPEIEDKIVNKAVKMKPSIVGLPCKTPEVSEVKRVSSRIKERLPETIIVVGGTHATVKPEDLLKDKTIDYAVIGEGEETLYELVRAIVENQDNHRDIPGLAWMEDSQVKRSIPRDLIEDLDSLPFLAYDKLPMDFYTFPQSGLIRGVIISGVTIFTSRGCPYRCIFCSSRKIFGKKVRFLSPKRVVDELELLVNDYKIDGFYILDDTFTVNKKHVIELCRELRSRKLDLLWGCETRVNQVNSEIIGEMKKAGCIQIDFGVESGSQKVLDTLCKDITIEQTKKAFSICRSFGVRTFANFLVNNPNENLDDIEKTISLGRDIKPDTGITWILTPYPGTELYEILGRPKISEAEYRFLFMDYKFDKIDQDNPYERLKQPALKDADLLKLRIDITKKILGVKYWLNIVFPFPLSRAYFMKLLKSKKKKNYIQACLFKIIISTRFRKLLWIRRWFKNSFFESLDHTNK